MYINGNPISIWLYNQTSSTSGFVTSSIANNTYILGNNATVNGLINNGSYLSTYNATYAQFAYNQTLTARNIFDQKRHHKF